MEPHLLGNVVQWNGNSTNNLLWIRKLLEREKMITPNSAIRYRHKKVKEAYDYYNKKRLEEREKWEREHQMERDMANFQRCRTLRIIYGDNY